MRGLAEGARNVGFSATPVKGSFDALIKRPLPIIAHIRENDLLHYVVIHKITKRKVLIADPREALRTLSHDQFLSIWTKVALLIEAQDLKLIKGERRGPIFRSVALLGECDHLVAICLLVSLVPLAATLACAQYLNLLNSAIIPQHDWSGLNSVSLALLLMLIFRSASIKVRAHVLIHLGRFLDRQLIERVCERFPRLPASYFDNRLQGDVLGVISDSGKVKELLTGPPLIVLLDSITSLLAITIIAFQNLRLAIILLALLVSILATAVVLSKKLRAMQRSALDHSSRLQSYVTETFNSINLIKVSNAEKWASARSMEILHSLLPKVYSALNLSATGAMVADLGIGLGLLLGLWLTAQELLHSGVTGGGLAATYAILTFIAQPVQRMAVLGHTIQDSLAAAERFHGFLEIPFESNACDLTLKTERQEGVLLNIDDVQFVYPGRPPLLSGLSLSVNPGEIIGIHGRSGSGKTTLAKLLVRLYEPSAGTIRLGGTDITSVDLASLRRAITYVQADSPVFAGTILDNLLMGRTDVELHQVVDAVKRAGMGEWVATLPYGLSTSVGSRGNTLSLGQRQKLALARALLSQPLIFILDEITSSLDSESEKDVLRVIRELAAEGRAVILISHRQDTLSIAHRTVTLEGGRIVQHTAPSPPPELEFATPPMLGNREVTHAARI